MTEFSGSKSYSSGETIFYEGDPGFVAYFIRKGNVIISRKNAKGATVIATRGPGEVVGEMALVSGARRSATARAATDCVLKAVTKDEVCQRMDEADPILKILLLTAFERLRENAARTNDYIPTEKA